NLSGANGYDTIRSLRRYVGTLGIKVLALVDEDSPEQEAMARSAGADGVLTRPIMPDHLMKTIASLMVLTPQS
ncbi:MAG TPA: hypothetical protein V6D06_02940, partial [Trichocoleus sp.]